MSQCRVALLFAMLSLVATAAFGQSQELRTAHRQVTDLFEQGRYDDAVPFAEESVRLSEQEFGAEHPTTATLIDNLARLHRLQGRLEVAESLYRRGLAIRTVSLDKNDPKLAASHDNLGIVYTGLERYADAEEQHWEAVRIMEQSLARRPHVVNQLSRSAALYKARALYNRARVFEGQQRIVDADHLYEMVVSLFEAHLGPDNSALAPPLERRAQLLRQLGRADEAAELTARAAKIRTTKSP